MYSQKSIHMAYDADLLKRVDGVQGMEKTEK